MKVCKACGENKDLTEFRKSGKYYRPKCKPCERMIKNKKRREGKWQDNPETKKQYQKKYYKSNKDKLNKDHKEYYKSNKEVIKKRANSYYEDNKEEIRLKQKLYYNTDLGFRKHSEKRIRSKLLKSKATPKWADKDKIQEFYRACPQGFHVDHIIPIKGENVCGLNIVNNLQYLTRTENTSKQNKFDSTLKNNTWRKDCNILKRVYSPEELKREYSNILVNTGYDKPPKLNKITTHFNPHFYETENNLWKNLEIRDKLINNREKFLGKKKFTDPELLRGFKISGIHYGFSHHSPFWIKKFIQDFNITSIYDPCGGWGHRLLGSHGIKYIYNDIDERSVRGAMDMSKFLDIPNNTFYCKDASTFTPKEEYEAVFTCPPYFDTEKYTHRNTSSNKFKEYNEWLEKFWKSLIKSSIKNSTKYFSYIISEKYEEDMTKVAIGENMSLVDKIRVGIVNKSHLHKTSNKDNRDILVILKTNH